ncbi:MAG: MFS transporter [Phycisphaerales bacterium]
MAGAPLSGPLGRRVLFGALYFSEGAPIGYIWWAMPTKLRAAGMPVEQVGALTAMLTLPWALKFLWAPLVDGLRGPRWGLRSWVTLAQVLMGLTLLPLVAFPLEDLVAAAPALLFAHAVFAATQDVGIDALAVRTLTHDERGRVTGWMQAGMLTSRAIFGGAILYTERWLGEGGAAALLIGCIWFSMVMLWCSPADVRPGGVAARERFGVLGRAIVRALGRSSTWLGVGIALVAGAGFEAAGWGIGPMLIDRGVEEAQVGLFRAAPVVGCMVVGALAGGWLADRIGHRRLVVASVLAIAASIGLLGGVDSAGASARALMVVASVMYLFIGSLTASSYALFMDLSDPAIGGTQFSAFMSATNLCEVWAVAGAGLLVAGYGYGLAFLVPAGVSLLALPLVWMLPERASPETCESL